MKRDEVFPRWARELERYLSIKSLYFLHNNIHDRYAFPNRKTSVTLTGLAENEALVKALERDRNRFKIEGETVTIDGILYRGERDLLLQKAGDNGPQLKAIAALYSESRNFETVAGAGDLKWSRMGMADWIYNYLALQGYSVVTYYDLADGFTFPDGNSEMRKLFQKLATAREEKINAEDEARAQAPNAGQSQRSTPSLATRPLKALPQIRSALRNTEISTAVIVRFSSRDRKSTRLNSSH